MKKVIVSIILLSIIGTVSVTAQNKSDRFFNESAELLCKFAHPTVKFTTHSMTNYGSTTRLNISYDNGKHQEMSLAISIDRYGEPLSIRVIEDTGFWPAFGAMELAKDFALTKIKESIIERAKEKGEELTYVQKQLLDEIEDAGKSKSGEEVATLILKLMWASYEG